MSPWPNAKVIAGAVRGGIALLFKSENGEVRKGFKSDKPWIYWSGATICERCDKGLRNPPEIKVDSGGPNEPSKGNSPSVYAYHMLVSTLNPFYKKHKNCKKKEENEPRNQAKESVS